MTFSAFFTQMTCTFLNFLHSSTWEEEMILVYSMSFRVLQGIGLISRWSQVQVLLTPLS